jgi:hypothetical protein
VLALAPGVSSVSLDELRLRSDFVVLGRINRVEQIPREVPAGYAHTSAERWRYEPVLRIAVVDVARVFRGPEDLKTVLFLAESTWTCDVTRGEMGETGLYFLTRSKIVESEEEVFRKWFSASFGTKELLSVMHAGRGRMPVREVDTRPVVDFWSNVRVPETLTILDGPNPSYPSVIKSIPLDEITDALTSYRSLDEYPWLSATAFATDTEKLAWDLLVARDGTSRLSIHDRRRTSDAFPDPSLDRVRLFHASEEGLRHLEKVVEHDWTVDLPPVIGSESAVAWQREMHLFQRTPTVDGSTGRSEQSVKISRIDSDATFDVLRSNQTLAALRIWKELRGLFDLPECVDLRPEDARWLR